MSSKFSRNVSLQQVPPVCKVPIPRPPGPPPDWPIRMMCHVEMYEPDWVEKNNILLLLEAYYSIPNEQYNFHYHNPAGLSTVTIKINLIFTTWPTDYRIYAEWAGSQVPGWEGWNWYNQTAKTPRPFETILHRQPLWPASSPNFMKIKLSDLPNAHELVLIN